MGTLDQLCPKNSVVVKVDSIVEPIQYRHEKFTRTIRASDSFRKGLEDQGKEAIPLRRNVGLP